MIKIRTYNLSKYKERSLRKYIKNLGIYAMDSKQNIKNRDYTPRKLRKVRRITKRVYKRDKYKTWILLEFLKFMQDLKNNLILLTSYSGILTSKNSNMSKNQKNNFLPSNNYPKYQNRGELLSFTQLSTRSSVQKIFYRSMMTKSTTGGKLKDSSSSVLEHKPTDFKIAKINPKFAKTHSFSTLAGNSSVDTTKTTVKNSDHYNHDASFGKSLDQRIRETHQLPLNTEKTEVTALTIVENQNISNFPENSLCSAFMTKRQQHIFVLCVSLEQSFKEKPPIVSLMFYAILIYGNPGDNSNMIQQVFPKTLQQYGPQNLLVVLPPEALMNISKEIKKPLGNVIYTRHYNTVLEIATVYKINKNFRRDQVIFVKEKNLSGDPGYYNRSPNSRPDTLLELHREICTSAVTKKGVDIKMTGTSSFKDKDIIQTAPPETFVKSVMQASWNLRDQVLSTLNKPTLNEEDKKYARDVIKDINDSIITYSSDRQAEDFASRHNAFHEAHSEFFTKYEIGINLQVCLSTESLNLDSMVGMRFKQTYQEQMFSPESKLNRFLKDKQAVYPEGYKISDPELINLIFEFFKKVG